MVSIELLADAVTALLSGPTLAYLLFGTLIGLTVGVLPGLGGVVGMSLVLPFLFGLDPMHGIALMMGVLAVIATSDTFPSVLLGVPGSVGSQATIMDGYPLARKGEAVRALSAAFVSSMFGGLVGGLAIIAILGIVRPLILSMGSPELFMLTLLGLAMVSILSRGESLAGVMSALFGMGLGLVGMAPADGVTRFTFGTLYLFDGVSMAVLAMGFFALPELIDLLKSRGQISEAGELAGSRVAGILQGVGDVFRNGFLVVRSALLGVGVGFIPGLGGAVVDWLSYGFAKQTCKNSESFGSGDIRGVIAPESSNNSKDGGALIPTLVFGIPGSGGTAIFLGGLIILGLRPGPSMVRESLDATAFIIIALVAANVAGTILCFGLAPLFAKISLVKAQLLVPVVMVVLAVGSYQASQSVGDLALLAVSGALGWRFKHSAWPRPPLLIGFALAAGAERYLGRSVALFGWQWLTDTGVIIIGVITIVVLVLGWRGAPVPTEVPEEVAETS